ncbi:MAG: tRNA pseudouridine(38-40) synthase TruA [Planctomycetota bacterium]|nr:MAG: tRNA pseudouridine(38-40) synthase TruA [Planctomycetota bacterium]
MRAFKLTLAYDGTNYSGWQLQPERVTLQGTFERALGKVAGEPIRVVASGRTDAGVHALGQVVGFRSATRLQPDVLQRALNSELPDDIAVVAAELVDDDFHAIASVRRKRYRYLIHDGPIRDIFLRPYVWQCYRPLDAEAMQRAAQALVGEHDFSSFETSGSPRESSVRHVFELTVARGQGGLDGWLQPRLVPEASLSTGEATGQGGHVIRIEIEADGFLYNMVRAIVGTLVEVGHGKRDEAWPGEALAACDRKAAGRTAPPQGLFLLRVDY